MSSFDLLIKNGTIITMDSGLSKKRWIAVKDGVIKALGDTDDYPDSVKDVVDLGGRALVPGFIDTHVHSSMTGIGQMGIDLTGINTIQGILDAVQDHCDKDPSDKVVCGCNMLTQDYIEEKRMPNRYELDEVSGGHPVMLVLWTAHGGTMNSGAIKKAELTDEMKAVEKDGYFNEDKIAMHIIGNIYNLMSDSDFEEIYINLSEKCASQGITTLHSLDGMMVKNDRDTDILLRIIDKLPIEFVNYTQTFDWQKILGYGLKRIGGCLCVDGSPPQITAAYQEPYPIAPHTRGFLNFTDKELYDFVTATSKAGMQTGFHAIGDRAVDQIMNIYQQVDKEIGIRHLRHRIEHFSVPTDRHIEMAAEMNIICAAQPAIGNMLDGPSGNGFESFVTKEKAQIHENFARVMKGGVVVTGGSDSPVTKIDALFGINAAVNAFNPARRVSLTDAIKMYTLNAAYAAHQEKEKGSLEVGKQADMIILSKDPYCPDVCSDLTTVAIEETFRKGKSISRRRSGQGSAP